VVIESFTAKVKSIARAAAIWRALAPTQTTWRRMGCASCAGCCAEDLLEQG
jgi:Pyruvate/2-oxoacid:ferredoxin oxidoreductase delta subunit